MEKQKKREKYGAQKLDWVKGISSKIQQNTPVKCYSMKTFVLLRLQSTFRSTILLIFFFWRQNKVYRMKFHPKKIIEK